MSATGLIERWGDWLPITDQTPVVSLCEGDTPLVRAPAIEREIGGESEVYVKFDGANPTGSFKDRGMTLALSKAMEAGSRGVICASTGNTSASAAAYAGRAGIPCWVVLPSGKVATGKLAQALVHGARVVAVDGNFDEALQLVRAASESQGLTLVNSVNPFRLEGQKTVALEIWRDLGAPPTAHFLPVGNAGNITATWKGYCELAERHGLPRPKMHGFQAAGAAPIVAGKVVEKPETIATAIRIGNPASWKGAETAARESGGAIESVTDEEILEAYGLLARHVGVFCEPASAASVAGLLKRARTGDCPRDPTPTGGTRGANGECGMIFTITAPGSSANLGPGFDSLGLAVDVPLMVRVDPDPTNGFGVEVRGEGQGILPEDGRNWILQTAREVGGAAVDAARWTLESAIPLGRGLGSSAAAAAVGIAAGHLLRDGTLPDPEALFDAVVAKEGHPDNAAATVFGGFRVSGRDQAGRWGSWPGALATDAVKLLLVIPEIPLPTKQARSVLPRSYPRAAAVRNLQYLGPLLAGLAHGDWGAVRMGCHDQIHEPYRLPLVPGLADALEVLRHHRSCAGAYLSGAGPTLAAFVPESLSRGGDVDEAAQLACAALRKKNTGASTRLVDLDTRGLHVQMSGTPCPPTLATDPAG
jgi:threonine synthase